MPSTSDLVAGLAGLLAAAGVGVWKPTGSYDPSETGITDTAVPPTPDRLIVLTVYGGDDDPTGTDATVLVQVRSRGDGDPRTSAGLQDDVFGVLQNLPRQTVGGFVVAGCWRRSGPAPLGADSSGRYEHTSNYELATGRPAGHPTT